MRLIEFGMMVFRFTQPRDDKKPERVDISYHNELLYQGTPEQLYRMLKTFKLVSQGEKIK